MTDYERVEALYQRLGVPLNGDMLTMYMWVPLVERIVEQLERVDVINNVTRDYTFKEAECIKPSRRPVKKSEVV